MTDNITPSGGGDNVPILSVGELSSALRRSVEGAFGRVRVRGEVSGAKRPGSGHLYLSLKDENAVLDGVCWKGTVARLGFLPEDGMEVIATGKLTTYQARSRYQIVIDSLELAGEGALLKLLDDRRRKLAAEGLFDAGLKRRLPYVPDVIGVITSPTGAVIRDILHRLSDRFPRRVIVWPVLVQGEGAAEQVAAAVRGFNRLGLPDSVPRPDLLIVARGGGSLEDLWAFNEEAVVRAVAASDIPVISAVGHETDTTLVDFAADVRAPTPTAAAEMAVPVRIELLAQVMNDASRLAAALSRLLAERRMRLAGLVRGLPRLDRVVAYAMQRLDDWSERLGQSLAAGVQSRRMRLMEVASQVPNPRHRLQLARQRLEAGGGDLARAPRAIVRDRRRGLAELSRLMESFSHANVLARGFALVCDRTGKTVLSAASVGAGQELAIEFADGKVKALAMGDAKMPVRKKRPRAADDPDQGSLL